MNVHLKLASACVLGGLMVLATSLQAITATSTANPPDVSDNTGDNSNPYAVIVDRNVFHLNPIPPPPVVEQKPKDLPTVYLNGIVKIGEDVRVLFSIPSKDAKIPTSYFKLAPGEKDGDLELVNIHPDQQAVDVVVSGTAMTLSMLSNNILASASAKAAAKGTEVRAAMRPGAPTFAPPTAAADKSAVIVGGEAASQNSSGYGSVTVAGGGNIATFGGGNTAQNSGGSGVTVAGGGGFGGNGGGSPGIGGNGTVGGANSPGQQIANSLFSGGQAQTQVANLPPSNIVPPSQQALDYAAFNALHGGTIPMPPAIQAAVDGQPYNPRGNR